MVALYVLWWLDKENPPADDGIAQVVWVSGQWEFVPFSSDGTLLKKRCGTREEAYALAAEYDSDIILIESFSNQETDILRHRILELDHLERIAKCKSLKSEALDTGLTLPSGASIHNAGVDDDGPFLFLESPRRIFKYAFLSLDDVFAHVTIPNP